MNFIPVDIRVAASEVADRVDTEGMDEDTAHAAMDEAFAKEVRRLLKQKEKEKEQK